MQLKLLLKKILFPGLDIGTRKRMKFIKYLRDGDILTLDAGCGNGAFSFAAYKFGNQVIGVDFDKNKLGRCITYRDYIGINENRCKFITLTIYELASLDKQFDQIICFETLEHLANDKKAIEIFSSLLKPGGLLHLCTPRSDRKPYYGERISTKEDGGHVRLGYTRKEFKKLLTPCGLTIINEDDAVNGISKALLNIMQWVSLSPFTARFSSNMKTIMSVVPFLLLYPLTIFDPFFKGAPLNIYVCAQKIK